MAVLDVHGEWHVLSWEGVTWIALHAPDEKARVFRRAILTPSLFRAAPLCGCLNCGHRVPWRLSHRDIGPGL